MLSSVNGKTSSHAKSENVTPINYRASHAEEEMQTKALKLEEEKEVLSHMEHPTVSKTKSFTLNLDGSVASSSKTTVEESIKNAWVNAYGIPANRLSVDINDMDSTYVSKSSGSDVTRIYYTVSVKGESYHKKIEEADQKTLESYFNSGGLYIVEGEITPYKVETTLDEPSTYIPSFATPTILTTLTSSEKTKTETKFLEETIYLKGNISDNYQPLVQSMLQSAMDKSLSDSGTTVTSYVVEIIERTVHTDKSGNTVVGYRYQVKDSSGGPPPSLSEEQSRTFTNQVTIELHNTNVFKQDEVVLYNGTVQGLSSVGSTGDSTANKEVIVTTLEPGRETNKTETTWVSFEPGVAHQPKGDTEISLSEHFVSDYGKTESVNISDGTSTKFQEVTYHSEQFSTQVFHIEKGVFAESQQFRIVHNEDDGKNDF